MMAPAFPPRDEVIDALEQLAQYGVPAQGAAQLLDVGSADFLRYFETETLDQLVCRGGATCKLFEGPYGSGKTHLLQLLKDLALSKGMAVVRTDLSQALSLEDWHLIAQHILQHIEVMTDSGCVTSLPKVVEALAREGRIDGRQLQSASLPHQGFARAIGLLSDPESLSAAGRDLVSRFLLGERVSVAQLKAHGVTGIKHPLSGRNAELVVKTVFAALFRLGVPGTLLLFDENEQTFAFKRSVPPRRIVLGANLLRRLIDASASGSLVATVAVFAVLPGFVENCALAYAALGQRLQLVRDGRVIGWRSPVVPLDAISTEPDPDAFLTGLVDRVTALLRHCGVELNGQQHHLHEAGQEVLQRNAGSGYRRALVKRIATMTLQQL